LTESGQRKALSREVAAEVGKFGKRIREEGKALDRHRRQLQTEIEARVSGDAKLSEARCAEWRQVLRAMSREERIATLRAAAAGKGPAAGEIVATVLGASSPLLLGLGVNDPVIGVIFDEHRQRLAGGEVRTLDELDEVQEIARRAEEWLTAYAGDLLGGEAALRDAIAVAQGARSLSELSTAEKVRRATEGIAAGLDPRDALYTPAEGEGSSDAPKPLTPGDVANFAARPLADKVAAGADGGERGLSPAEIIRSMRD
jgi:hypothetical protein